MPQQFTAFGRIVWGHPGKPKTPKNDDTGQPKVKQDGSPVQQWSFGLAIEKMASMQARGAPQAEYAQSFEHAVWPYLDAEAKTGFPNGVPPDFSWKWKDGDSMDRSGKSYAEREGYAGHYVLAISTEAFAPTLYKQDAPNMPFYQITADQLKTGDYVAVSITAKLNIPTNRNHKPGLYINPNGIQFIAYGKEIINGPDAQAMFGGQPQYALPPGASTQPMMPTGGAQMPQQHQQQPGGMPGHTPPQPMGQPMQQPMGQPMQQPGAMPGQMPMGQPMQQPMGQPMQQPMGQPMQQPGAMPGQMPMGGHAPQQPMQQQPGQMPMGQPGAMPPPATDFVQNAGQMPVQQMPGQMPPR